MAHEYTVTHCKGSILNGGLPTNVAADNLHLRDGFFFFTKSLGSMQGEYNVFVVPATNVESIAISEKVK